MSDPNIGAALRPKVARSYTPRPFANHDKTKTPTVMKLYLVRHGLTVENATGIIQGHNPGELTELGIAQAQRLAERLKGVHFDAIYASDLRRAADTARAIARYHTMPVHYTEHLRERHAGIFQGRPATEFEQAQAQSGLPHKDFCPVGGESYADLRARVANFITGLRRTHARHTVLLVAHGRWNRMLLGLALGKSIEESLDIKQANTCVNIIEWDEQGRCSVPLLNCAEHLKVIA
jgi:broad specificity phosphatase PhoE